MRFDAVTATRSYEQVVQQIQDQIRHGQLVLGQKLPTERALGDAFGVSRGVVREAVKVLNAMGLVESRQGSGLYVRNNPGPAISRVLTLSATPDEQSIHRLFEFREPLEVLAAWHAARRRSHTQLAAIDELATATAAAAAADDGATFGVADPQFHAAIGAAADNSYLAAVLAAVHQMQRDVVQLLARQSGSMRVAAAQHAAIAETIARGAADEAAAAMREHVRYAAAALRAIEGAGETPISVAEAVAP